MKIICTGIALTVCAFAFAEQSHAQTTSYHIGNSLTRDSQPLSLEPFVGQTGLTHTVGRHIRCGSSLPDIWADLETCVDPIAPFGTYDQALPNHDWDFITIQPFPDSTLSQDRTIIGNFIDLSRSNGRNSNTRILIYQAWPQTAPGRVEVDYTGLWDRSAQDSPEQAMLFSHDYFDLLIDDVRGDHPGTQIDIIPVGEVFAELDRRLKSGELVIADYTDANDFYRDLVNLHMNSLGRFVAASTVYATMFGEDPTGLTSPDGFFDEPDIPENGVDRDSELLTPEVQAALQGVVWDVVSTHEFSGVPEPSSLGLLLCGSGFWVMRRRPR